MAFTGTLDKCKACDKTVYVVDLLTADGASYHKSCFRCSHCHGMLVMSNYSSLEGVLYCKPHFEQLFKETGSFNKSFHLPPKSPERPELARAPSKISAFFSGTQDKCAKCNKTVYPLEKITVEGQCYHNQCFRCSYGGCALTISTYASLDSIIYCKHHFAQLFMEKGNYEHLIKSATAKQNGVNGIHVPDDAEQNVDQEKEEPPQPEADDES